MIPHGKSKNARPGSEIPEGRDIRNSMERNTWEVERGWITELVDIPEAILRTAPLTPRFAISQHHGNQPPNVRLIVDFRAYAINSIVETSDACIPAPLEVFISLSSYLALVAPECDIFCVTADFAHAYKHSDIR